MKKLNTISLFSLIIMAVLYSCSDKEKLQKVEEENVNLTSELQQTLATQDSLFQLINDITVGMNQIKEMEHILSNPASLEEMPSRKEQIQNDMILIQQALQQRRERLAELENKLKKSNSENATLLKTIENLKNQIKQQEMEMSDIRAQLEQANIQIEFLDNKIESLNNEVADISVQREEARKEATKLNDELNICYYVVGNKKELQDNNIMKSGFLRKTKIMPEDYDKSYFIQADKRTLSTIPLHSKKAEIMTNQPAGSYQIVEISGQKVLKILDLDKFWEFSPFLVIKID